MVDVEDVGLDAPWVEDGYGKGRLSASMISSASLFEVLWPSESVDEYLNLCQLPFLSF